MKPLILLDFDRTLFRTDDYWQDFAMALAKSTGKPENYYANDYYVSLEGEGRLQMIDYGKILALTGAKHQQIKRNLAEIAGKKQLLFADALGMLRNIQNSYDVAIVTFGENRYQSLKISLVPEIAGIPTYIIQMLKNEFIVNNFAGRQGMLVDDKFGQDLPPGWTEVYLDRQANCQNPVTISDAVYKISTLDDVLKFKFDHEKGFVYV